MNKYNIQNIISTAYGFWWDQSKNRLQRFQVYFLTEKFVFVLDTYLLS